MSRKTILLVEDDQDQVVLALRALRKHGISAEVDDVVVVESGEEAVGYLPGFDGLEVLKRLREDELTSH